MFGLHPIHWVTVFSKDEWLDFSLAIFGYSKHQIQEPEIFLFGLHFCLRGFPFASFTILGFQFYFSKYHMSLFWPNGSIIKEIKWIH